MNIGYFTDTYSPQINGVVTSIKSFRKETEKLKSPVYLFCPKIPGQYGDDTRVFRFPSIKSFIYPEFRETLPLSPKIMNLIPKLHLDVLHVQTPGQIGLLGTNLAIKYHLPLIFTYHTLYPEYFDIYKAKATPMFILGLLAYPFIVRNPLAYRDLVRATKRVKISSKWTKELIEELSALFANQTDGVIAPSPKIKKLLLRWGVKKPVTVIPTGVELKEFTGKTENFRKSRKLGDDLLVTYAGRLGQEKNVHVLIKAFAHAARKLPSSRLLILGDGPYRKELMSLAKKTGLGSRIIFTGFVERKTLISALKQSDMFIFPSMTDTQALTVLEAAACGLPLILSDQNITGVLKDGKNGYYAKPTPNDIAAKIVKLGGDENLRNKFGKVSLARVKQYSSTKLTKELLAFYKKVIDAKEKPTIRDPKTLL